MTSGRSSVSVSVVTHNSSRFIRNCLQYILAQDYGSFDVIIVDISSTDQSGQVLREFEDRVHVIYNSANIGFAAAHNQAVSYSKADWFLVLYPDVRLRHDFISMIVDAGEADASVGGVSGKLLRMSPDFEVLDTPILDSTGIYFTPNLRHFDRGSGEPDRGQYEQLEYVFGVTGAAALYRRQMIDDISIAGEFFDSQFFAYREDADVAWRAQLLGWKCLYTPLAVAYHVRSVLPSNRRSIAPVLNMHSVKNRFLMRIKNTTAPLYLRHFFAITTRDCLVIAGCLFGELSSLRAFPWLVRNLRRTWAKRRQIMQRRRATDDYLVRWFASRPVSYPAPELMARLQAQQTASR
jgi:GT2 family glycosyltransferase